MSDLWVCTSSFVDGSGRYFAGISFAHPRCDVVLRNPRQWGSTARTVDTAGFEAAGDSWLTRTATAGIDSSAVAVRSRSAATVQRRPTVKGKLLPTSSPKKIVREIPQLRVNAKPTLTVRLNLFAREAISEEIRYSREFMEDQDGETGGWLFGERDRGIWLLSATQLGDGRRKRGAVTLDWKTAENFSKESSMSFLGAWHCHPTPGRTEPSGRDRALALESLERHDLRPTSFAIDLIATPDGERGWRKPIFTAWRTSRNEHGRAFTEPATLDLSPLSRR